MHIFSRATIVFFGVLKLSSDVQSGRRCPRLRKRQSLVEVQGTLECLIQSGIVADNSEGDSVSPVRRDGSCEPQRMALEVNNVFPQGEDSNRVSSSHGAR